MELNQYQIGAMGTCMPESSNPLYMLFEIGGEMGELQEKFAKAIRKGQIKFVDNDFIVTDKMSYEELEEWKKLVKKEVGDIQWGIAGICHVMGWSLEEIAQLNLEKLADRAKRAVIEGDGDER